MRANQIIFVVCFALLPASPAFAQIAEKTIVQQLSEQGYVDVTVSQTLLGRARIIALKNGATREIVLNPRTGEILRDYSKPAEGEDNRLLLEPDQIHSDEGATGPKGASDEHSSESDGGADHGGDSQGVGSGENE